MEASRDTIAIIGIGCRAPGADNISEFWRLLERGENHVVDIPPERWNARAYYDPDPMTPGRSYVMKAGLVKSPEAFDNRLYGINDLEAIHVDPQQRFVLDCVTMAMEDAGITRAMLKGSRTGVYMGVTNSDYRSLFPSQSSDINNYTVTGISNSIIAARVSYVWDLRGPSLVLDTACSSSLIAMHLGIQAIRTGDCDVAICGGTNYLTLPDIFVFLSKARMISPGGQCRPFSADADGYARGEGCGVVILKRLCDAERDGDNIWATINTTSNQDGHTVTPLIAPSGQQQQQLLCDMYSSLGDDVDNIDYIEAHGTGTPAGDPVEAEALGTVFERCGAQVRDRFVGSVKSNIGHLEPAAGVMGVIKVLLMMRHGKIVPSLFFSQPNPRINFSALHLTVPTRLHEWKGRQKVAVCNSFGFGGSNCHAVLKEYSATAVHTVSSPSHKRPCVVCFTANSERSLLGSVQDFLDEPGLQMMNIHDIAYTSTARRHHFAYRVSKVVEDVQELVTALEDPGRVKAAITHTKRKPRVVFVFCGMGTSWPGMCLSLSRDLPVFREKLEEIDRLLSSHVTWSLLNRLEDQNAVKDPEFSPIAIFACQVALTALWRSVGVDANCIVGQSVGEVAAAHAAGCLDLQQAVRVVYHRTRLLAQATGGAMIVVRNHDVQKVKQIIMDAGVDVDVSLQYSQRACALSGDDESLSKLRHLLASETGAVVTSLDVPVAYHSRHVDSCTQPLAHMLEGLASTPPGVPFVSSVTGAAVTTELGADYWVKNLREPVLFYDAVKAAHDSKHSNSIFVEIGPKPVLRAHLEDIFPGGKVRCVTSMYKDPELNIFLEAVSALYDQGVDVAWERLPTLGSKVTPIPRYVFDSRPLLPRGEGAALLLNGVTLHQQQHSWVWKVNEPGRHLLMICPRLLRSLYDHVMSGRVIVPGSFYGEVGFAIAAAELKTKNVSMSLDFVEPLVIDKNRVEEVEIRTRLTRAAGPDKENPGKTVTSSVSGSASVYARVVRGTHTAATITIKPLPGKADNSNKRWVNLAYLRSKCPDEVPKSHLYNSLNRSGFQYGENFKLLEDIYKGPKNCLATIRTTETIQQEYEHCTIHHCVLDCMLHSTVLIQDSDSDSGIRPVMPKSIDKLVVHHKMEPVMMTHAVKTYEDSELCKYHVTLVSLEGLVIAEVSNLVVLFLDRHASEVMRDLYTSEWHAIEEGLPQFEVPSDGGLEDSVLFLTTGDLTNASAPIRVSSPALHKGLTAECLDLLKQNTHSAVAVVCAGSLLETSEASETQEAILSSCLLIKDLLFHAENLSLTIPIFVCTQKAWPSPEPSGDFEGGLLDGDVNPVHTAVWGLIRAAVRENVYPSLVAVDVQSMDLEGKTSLNRLSRLLLYLSTESKAKSYPEMLVTGRSVFVNRVVEVSSKVAVPSYRPLHSDPTDTPLLLSDHPTRARNQIAVLHEQPVGRNDQGTTELMVEAFAVPNNSMSMRCVGVSSEDFFQTYGLDMETDRYPVVAIETVGSVLGDKDKKVCCCPLVAEARVRVPADLISANVIPGYEPGDLTRLLFLWMVQKKVKSSHVTILTSSATHELGKLLSSVMHTRKINKKSIITNLVSLECWDTQGEMIHETVVSLVLIDGKLANTLTPRLVNTRHLVSFSALVDSETVTKLALALPKMEIKLLVTDSFLHPRSVAKHLPDLMAWVKANQSLVRSAVELFHSFVISRKNSEGTADDCELPSLPSLLSTETVVPTMPMVHATPRNLFRSNAVYIVVGGLTGLGWLCVQHLARGGAGGVAIVNRRQPSSDQLTSIQELSSGTSCNVHPFQADVTSLESVRSLLNDIRAVFQARPVRGVMYGAATVQDRPLFNLTREEFENVLAPKVKGTWNMHCVTKDMHLDFFLMHSSIASVFGNVAQSNYAAGNAFMDGLVYYRRSRGLTGQCINWGPLDLGILEGNTKVKQRLEAHGLAPLSQEAIMHKLTPLLMLNWEQITPVALDKIKMQNVHAGRPQVGFLRRLELVIKPAALTTEHHGSQDYSQHLLAAKSMQHDDRLPILNKYVAGISSQLLCLDPSVVTADSSLYDLGLDSVVAMSMVSTILTDTRVRLPIVLFVSGEPTVAAIARAISEGFDGKKWDDEMPDNGPSGPIIEEIIDEPLGMEKELEFIPDSLVPVENNYTPTSKLYPAVTTMDLPAIKDKVPEISDRKYDNDKIDKIDKPSEISRFTANSSAPYGQSFKCPLYGVIDIPLMLNSSNPGRIKAVIASLMDRHAALRDRYQNNGTSSKGGDGKVLSIHTNISLYEIDEGPDTAQKLDKETKLGWNGQDLPFRFILIHAEKPLLRVVFDKNFLDMKSAFSLAQQLEALLASRPLLRKGHEVSETSSLSIKNSLAIKNLDEFLSFWRSILDCCRPTVSDATSLLASKKRKYGRSQSTHWGVASDSMVMTPQLFSKVKAFLVRHGVSLLGLMASCYQILLHAMTGCSTIALAFPVDLRSFVGQKATCLGSWSQEIPLVLSFPRPSRKRAERSNVKAVSAADFVVAANRMINVLVDHSFVPFSQLPEVGERLTEVVVGSQHGIMAQLVQAGGEGAPQSAASLLHSTDAETLLCVQHDIPRETVHVRLNFHTRVLNLTAGRALLSLLMQTVEGVVDEPSLNLSAVIRCSRKKGRKLLKSRE